MRLLDAVLTLVALGLSYGAWLGGGLLSEAAGLSELDLPIRFVAVVILLGIAERAFAATAARLEQGDDHG